MLTSLGFHRITPMRPTSSASWCIASCDTRSCGWFVARLSMPATDASRNGSRPNASSAGAAAAPEMMSLVTSRMTACRPANC